MIVAQDGSGQFTKIQEAIDSIPVDNQNRIMITIKDGVYKEKLEINKPLITLVGTDRDKVKVTFDDYAKKTINGEKMGTFGSYSSIITADGFMAKNITFENNAGSGTVVGQAVAVYVDADQVEFHSCSFLGSQDTLFTAPLPPKPIEGDRFGGPRDGLERKKWCRSYFKDCYLEGDVDFIFGSATALFQDCEINSLDQSKEINGYITAASTPQDQKHGYVFIDCKLTSTAAAHTVYLGRPWRDYAKTVFINCWMGEHIREEGWHNWDKKHAEKTTYYAEYNSQGPGGNMEKREPWAKVLTEDELQEYTLENILGSGEKWYSIGKVGSY
jgi:pectinesterase